MFIAYEQLNVEGDDQSVEEAKEAGPPGTTGPVGNASARRVSPNGGFGTGASSPSKGSQYASTKSGAQTSISGTYQSDMFEESPDLVPFKANVVAISLEIGMLRLVVLLRTVFLNFERNIYNIFACLRYHLQFCPTRRSCHLPRSPVARIE